MANRGLCAVAQAESMRYKLLGGLAVRRACYGVLRFVMESGEATREGGRAVWPAESPVRRLHLRGLHACSAPHEPTAACPPPRPPPPAGAKGCEVIVSGKLRAQRAKSMKFKDGYMVSSGNPVHDYIDSATRHVLLRQVRLRLLRAPRAARPQLRGRARVHAGALCFWGAAARSAQLSLFCEPV